MRLARRVEGVVYRNGTGLRLLGGILRSASLLKCGGELANEL